MLFPAGGSLEEKPEHAANYAKTHGNIPAGEQKHRGYMWSSDLDPKTFPFGYGEQKLPNGVAKAVEPERYEQAFPKTVIVKKTVEDLKAVSQDPLGKVKNLGQGYHPISQDTVFGIKNCPDGSSNWNAAKCINGDPSARELEPDNDLGRCTKIGSRNVVRCEADKDRVFGCPTIRTDIPMKKMKSVADH